MPIDVEKIKGAPLDGGSVSWEKDDVILYHLGLGAGLLDGTDPGELEYIYEKNLKVLPTFGTIPVRYSILPYIGKGLDVDPRGILHGDHEIIVHRPLPVEAKIKSEGKISEIYDKGKSAIVVLEMESKAEGGEPLFTNKMSLYIRGEGGFGGDRGPEDGDDAMPDREPDMVVESPTMPNQAHLYRLNGDKNPMHADPEMARKMKFDKNFLHGLCSYGIACRAAVEGMLDGKVESVASYKVRFAGLVFPGETLVTSMWKESEGIKMLVKVKERDAIALSHAIIKTLGSSPD